MNNIPFSSPPDYVVIGDEKYKINSDFRVWVSIADMLTSEESFKKKLTYLLVNGYCDRLPLHIDDAVEALLNFLNVNAKGTQKSANAKVFDFQKDEGLIYAAFMQQYRINLYTAKLHWWEFLSLLSGLDENTAFMKIVGYRSIDLGDIKDEKQKRYYRAMKNKYRIKEIVNESDIAFVLAQF